MQEPKEQAPEQETPQDKPRCVYPLPIEQCDAPVDVDEYYQEENQISVIEDI